MITDFGLARRPVEGDPTDVELQGEQPCYLSPEQAWGRVKEIGPATDIYALGAILYELLTGRPPFRGPTASQTLDAIQCREVVPPSQRRRLPRDLDAVCRKCLAKQPRRRYASAQELADDLRRIANGYPSKARFASHAERLGLWLRRHFRGVAFVLMMLITAGALLALFLSGEDEESSPHVRRERYARQELSRREEELKQARQQRDTAAYLQNLTLAQRELADGDPGRAREWLNQCPAAERQREWYYLHDQVTGVKSGRRDFTAAAPVTCVAFSNDGRFLIAGSANRKAPPGRQGDVTVWDLAFLNQVQVRHWNFPRPVLALASRPHPSDIRPDQVAVVSGTNAGVPLSEVQVLNLDPTGKVVYTRPYPRIQLTTVAYSADQDNFLVAGSDGVVRTLRASDGDEVSSQNVTPRQPWERGGTQARLVSLDAQGFALVSPDGGRIAIRSGPGGMPGNILTTDLRGQSDILALAYNQPSNTLASASRDKTVRLWNLGGPFQTQVTLRGHKDAVNGVAFSSDGKRLATSSADGTVKIWDPEAALDVLTLKGFAGAAGVAFSPDGALVILHGRTVTVWSVSGGQVR